MNIFIMEQLMESRLGHCTLTGNSLFQTEEKQKACTLDFTISNILYKQILDYGPGGLRWTFASNKKCIIPPNYIADTLLKCSIIQK